MVMSFRLKTILGIAAIETVLLITLVWSGLTYIKTTNQTALGHRASDTAEMFSASLKNHLIASDIASIQAFFRQAETHEDLVSAYLFNEGGRKIAGFDKIPPSATTITWGSASIEEGGIAFGRVDVGYDTNNITSAVGEARRVFISIATVEIVLVALFSFLLGTHLTRRIKMLEISVNKVAGGEFSRVMSATSLDEIGRTITAFNRMVDVLKNSHDIMRIKDQLSEAHRIARLGYIEINRSDSVCIIGDGAHEMLGIDPSVKRARADVVFSHVPEAAYATIMRAIADTEINSVDLEMTVEGKALHAVGQSTSDMSGSEKLVVTLQDVTQQRAAEQERASLIQRLSEASRLESLGTLAGGVAHEINTPAQYIGDNLSFIKDWLPRLLDVVKGARAAVASGDWQPVGDLATAMKYDFAARELPSATDQALDGISRISAIVQAIKEFCYPSGNTPQPFDLNRTIETAATVTRSQWKHVATLGLDLASDLPQLNAVEGEINQVLVNLIVNAAQAIGEAGRPEPGRIEVRTRLIDRSIELAVTDTGVGIAKENLERLFELFFTTKPAGQGTGQGLAITKAIVHRHGGTITVESEPGAGACFRIILPIAGPTPIPT